MWRQQAAGINEDSTPEWLQKTFSALFAVSGLAKDIHSLCCSYRRGGIAPNALFFLGGGRGEVAYYYKTSLSVRESN